jgi:hypothetical protein
LGLKNEYISSTLNHHVTEIQGGIIMLLEM